MRIAQNQILTKVIDKGSFAIILDNGLTEDFFPTYKREFNFIKDHYEKFNCVPDKTTFYDTFPKFMDIGEVTEPDNYLIAEIYKEKKLRELFSTMQSIETLIRDGDTDSALEAASRLATDIKGSSYLTATNLLTDISRYDEYVDKMEDFSDHYTSTGFKELDEALGGWDRHEEIATIVARPGVGKSWFILMSLLGALKSGLTVGLYSGEMSKNKVGFRFDTLVSNISNSAILRGKEFVQNEYKDYLEELKDRFKGDFYVITPRELNGEPATVSDLEAFVNKYNLDILFIDQHSLLEDQRKGKSPVEKAANISKDLKSMQTRVGIPIISASQQNRSGEDNKRDKDGNRMAIDFDVSRVAQTDRIGQDSTVVIFLEREKENYNIFNIHIVKARDGLSSTNTKFSYTVDLDKGVFVYNPIEENGEADAEKCQELKEEYEPEGFEPAF